MAGIQVGQAQGKKAVDAEIPLVPFIDLLLCCVMFLLVTAVWNELGRIHAAQNTPGPTADSVTATPREALVLTLGDAGYVLASTTGERTEIPKAGGAFDQEGLRQALEARARLSAERTLAVAPDDGVPYEDVVATLDVAVGEGFGDLSVGDSAR